ncbi:hypothetical protein HMPREF3232_00863 [Fannyhessea vaginae]|nr:hypothetical protein HMPREF3232_00863 [Fannyhessea vaginae]
MISYSAACTAFTSRACSDRNCRFRISAIDGAHHTIIYIFVICIT